MEENLYALPKLNFSFDGLEPYISREQIKIHYEKHHQAYVNAANAILERISSSRREGKDVDIKSTLKELSFNIGGHILHSIFWENLSTPKKDNKPEGKIGEAIEKEFGSFERFKKEFSSAALSVEGSGWA
ncbi:MAG: superoxide dismutase, partial [Candidatus Aenigmatarchaeota archaeon]